MEIFGRKEAKLTDSQREKYGTAFAYLERRALEVKTLTDNAVQLNMDVQGMHKRCLVLHKKVDTANRTYQRVSAAVSRLQNTMDSMDDFTKETESAWNKLAEVERKLFEFPLYASQKADNLDSILFG